MLLSNFGIFIVLFFEKQIDNETLTKSPFSTMFSSSSQ